MLSRIIILLASALLFAFARPAAALQFYLDLSNYSEQNTNAGYGVSIHLDASPGDFDELVDGFKVISPSGSMSVSASIDGPNGSFGLLFPSFAAATNAIFGNWTLQQTTLGLPFDSQTFRVRSTGLISTDLPSARVLSPAFDASGIPTTPVISFTGPGDATDIGLGLSPTSGSYPNDGFTLLPGTATQYTAPFALSGGLNEIFLIYYLQSLSAGKVTIEPPGGVSWSSLVSRSSVVNSRFTVDASVPLKLSGPERVGNQFRWSFPTETGSIYDVQFKDAFNAATWQLLQTINGDGAVKTFTVSPAQSARFFRIARR